MFHKSYLDRPFISDYDTSRLIQSKKLKAKDFNLEGNISGGHFTIKIKKDKRKNSTLELSLYVNDLKKDPKPFWVKYHAEVKERNIPDLFTNRALITFKKEGYSKETVQLQFNDDCLSKNSSTKKSSQKKKKSSQKKKKSGEKKKKSSEK